MLDYLSQNTAVATANNEHFLWIRVGVHGKVRDHLLIPACPVKLYHGRFWECLSIRTKTRRARCIG